jgi:hypothetical protein
MALLAPGPTRASAQGAGDSHLRIVHTAFDAPAVNIMVDSKQSFSNVAFKDVTLWVSIPAGQHDVKVVQAGKTEPVIDTQVTLGAGKYYTLIAGGKMANMSLKTLEDDLSPLAAGKARVRLVHASPDTPGVDADLNNGLVLVPNLGFLDASSYLELDAKTLDVKLKPAGTNQVAFSASNVTLEPGTVYTFIVVGLSQGNPPLSVVAASTPAGAQIAEALPVSGPSQGTQSSIPRTGAGDEGPFAPLPLAIETAALGLVAWGIVLRRRSRQSSVISRQ